MLILSSPDANPAVLINSEKNNERFYWDAVREFVDYNRVLAAAKGDFRGMFGFNLTSLGYPIRSRLVFFKISIVRLARRGLYPGLLEKISLLLK